MKYIFLVVGIIFGLGAGTMSGLTLAHNLLKPVEIIKEVPVEVKIYQDKIVEVPVIKTIMEYHTEYLPGEPEWQTARPFASVEEMATWLTDNRLPLVLIADSNGEISLNGQPSNPLYDCDDYAGELQRRALKDGFIMNVELDWKGGRLHALNSAIIGNDWYFIEPQTSEFWRRIGLD